MVTSPDTNLARGSPELIGARPATLVTANSSPLIGESRGAYHDSSSSCSPSFCGESREESASARFMANSILSFGGNNSPVCDYRHCIGKDRPGECSHYCDANCCSLRATTTTSCQLSTNNFNNNCCNSSALVNNTNDTNCAHQTKCRDYHQQQQHQHHSFTGILPNFATNSNFHECFSNTLVNLNECVQHVISDIRKDISASELAENRNPRRAASLIYFNDDDDDDFAAASAFHDDEDDQQQQHFELKSPPIAQSDSNALRHIDADCERFSIALDRDFAKSQFFLLFRRALISNYFANNKCDFLDEIAILHILKLVRDECKNVDHTSKYDLAELQQIFYKVIEEYVNEVMAADDSIIRSVSKFINSDCSYMICGDISNFLRFFRLSLKKHKSTTFYFIDTEYNQFFDPDTKKKLLNDLTNKGHFLKITSLQEVPYLIDRLNSIIVIPECVYLNGSILLSSSATFCLNISKASASFIKKNSYTVAIFYMWQVMHSYSLNFDSHKFNLYDNSKTPGNQHNGSDGVNMFFQKYCLLTNPNLLNSCITNSGAMMFKDIYSSVTSKFIEKDDIKEIYLFRKNHNTFP